MTDTTTSTTDPATAPTSSNRAHALLTGLVSGVPNVAGAVLGTIDGRVRAAVLPDGDPASTAALVASARGLGDRLADLIGEGQLAEIVVRSTAGYVVIYAAGDRGVLTVLTKAAANLALLHLRARDVAAELAGLAEDPLADDR